MGDAVSPSLLPQHARSWRVNTEATADASRHSWEGYALSITINSDMGESLGIHSFGNDEGLLPLIDTANVACGFHAGDPVGIRETVRSAAAAGVTVGAHPGLPDIVGFGRREMNLLTEEVRDIVLYQVAALKGFLEVEGMPLDHIKPHGPSTG